VPQNPGIGIINSTATCVFAHEAGTQAGYSAEQFFLQFWVLKNQTHDLKNIFKSAGRYRGTLEDIAESISCRLFNLPDEFHLLRVGKQGVVLTGNPGYKFLTIFIHRFDNLQRLLRQTLA
jgi:hypothetical protein